MITIINKKKGFYKVFDSLQDWEDFNNNGLKMKAKYTWKSRKSVRNGNIYRQIITIEYLED